MNLTVQYSSPDAPRAFTRSIRETGFAVLTDHPVPAWLVAETYKEWARFFASPDKEVYRSEEGSDWGYYPYRSENARDTSVKDLKEFYHVYAWSPLPRGMSDRTRRLFDLLASTAATLLGWVDDASPPDVRAGFSTPLRQMIEGSRNTVFRILHYPALSGLEAEGAVRSSAHEDINLLTLLPGATAPGLELLDAAGAWRAIACDPSSVVVNAGDMLQMASGGYFRSTTHRVVNPRGSEALRPRFSMPLFLHPRPEVRLSETRTAGEYLDERLREIGLRTRPA